MNDALKGKKILITGITDENSLALAIARQVQEEGAEIVCTGLGRTNYHKNLSEKAEAYLQRTYEGFQSTVQKHLGSFVKTTALDVTVDESLQSVCEFLKTNKIQLDGYVHSIAMDKTIRGGIVKPLLDVTREEFLEALDISAYSLINISRALVQSGSLNRSGSIVALSYLGAEKLTVHPYKNIGVAKAALERIGLELAMELGQSHSIKVNLVRFSPYAQSKAGGAIEGLINAVEHCNTMSPLGNARPEDLGYEVAYLLRPGNRITGEIRNVDGGYHIRG